MVVEALPRLEALWVGSLPCNATSLADLAALMRLTALHWESTSDNSSEAVTLAFPSTLGRLRYMYTNFHEPWGVIGYGALARLPSLNRLHVHEINSRCVDLAESTSVSSMTCDAFNFGAADSTGVARLTSFTLLCVDCIRSNTAFSGMRQLIHVFPRLVSLTAPIKITADVMCVSGALTGLTELRAALCCECTGGLLLHLSRLVRLERLCLSSERSNLTDDHLLPLARSGLPALRCLEIVRALGLTNLAGTFLAAFTRLAELQLSVCQNVGADGISAFVISAPAVRCVMVDALW